MAKLQAFGIVQEEAESRREYRLGKEAQVPTPVNSFITACLTVAHNRAIAQRESTDQGG
mgnify:CR=1 FL=1